MTPRTQSPLMVSPSNHEPKMTGSRSFFDTLRVRMSAVMLGVILTLLIAAAAPPMTALAKSQSGGVVDPSTILGFGTRPAAMGNAYVALGDDATSVYWNPASLDISRRKEIYGQYSQAYFDNTSYNLLAYKHPMGRFGTLGGGLILEGVDDLTRRDVNAANIGTFNVSKMNLMFSYGKQLTDGFYLGSSLHILRQQIAEFSGTGFGLDVGALYRFTSRTVESTRAYLRLARDQMHQDAERFYALGMRAYEGGRNVEAFEQFLKAVESDPEDKSARKMLLVTIQKDRALADRLKANPPSFGYPSMVEFLKTHAKKNGTAIPDIDSWYREGVRLYDAGKLKESIPFFEAVIRHARSNLVTDRLSFGLNAQNLLEPSIKLKTKADKIPMNIKTGAAYKLTDWLQFALDLDLPSKGPTRVHFGAEWRPIEWLAIRAGLDNAEPAFGIGFKYQDLRIDYAFMPSDDLDKDFQRVGLSYEFGKSHADAAMERIQRGLTLQSRKDFPAAVKEWESAQAMQPANPLPRRYIQETEETYRRTVTDPWAEAERHISAGRLMEANPILTAILSHDPAFEPARKAMDAMAAAAPSYVESHFAAGRLKFLQGDFAGAQDEMSRSLFFKPDHLSAELYRDAARKRVEETSRRRKIEEVHQDGLAHYRAGRWTEAEARFQTVLRRDASHPSAGALIGQIAQMRAAEFLPDEMRLESERFLRLAEADYLDDNVIRADLQVNHSLALWPDNMDAANLLARIAADRNRQLIDLIRRGEQSLARGDADKALAAWQEVLAVDPGNFDVQKRLEDSVEEMRNFIETMIRSAERFENAGQPLNAMKFYNRALAVDPYHSGASDRRAALRPQVVSYVEGQYAEAEMEYRRGELEKSMASLANLIAVDPDLMQARDLQEMAKQKFDQSVSLAKMRRLYREGMDLFARRKFDESVAVLRELVSQDVEHPDAMPIVEDARRKIDEAIGEAERERNQAFVADLLAAGDRHLSEGRAIDALMVFRQAREVQPENTNVQWRIESAQKVAAGKTGEWMNQADAAIAEGKLDDAAVFYQAILGVFPDHPAALEGLRRIEVERERPQDERTTAASGDVKPEAAVSEGAPVAPASEPPAGDQERDRMRDERDRILGRAAELRRKMGAAIAQNRPDIALGRAKGAIELYRGALKLDPSSATARKAVSDLGAEILRLQKTLKEKNAAAIQQHLYSGMGHYRTGRLKEAIADWTRVLSLDPGHVQAREYIKRAEKKQELVTPGGREP